MAGGPGPAPRACPPQTLSPFTWPKPIPQTPGHMPPGCSACGEGLEVRGMRTPRSPRALQPCPQIGWWPPLSLISAHSPLSGQTPPQHPLFSEAGEAVQPGLPCPTLEAPLLLGKVTRKLLPREFLPTCFSLLLVTGRSPPPCLPC